MSLAIYIAKPTGICITIQNNTTCNTTENSNCALGLFLPQSLQSLTMLPNTQTPVVAFLFSSPISHRFNLLGKLAIVVSLASYTLFKGNVASPVPAASKDLKSLDKKLLSPVPSLPSWWINPCGVSSENVNKASTFDTTELVKNILVRCQKSQDNAIKAKDHFFKNTFNDADFERAVAHIRLDWLPIIEPSANELIGKTTEYITKKAFILLQYFAIGVEEMLWGQYKYGGRFAANFKALKEDLVQLLCEVQIGMSLQRIEPDAHVLATILSHRIETMGIKSRRDERDFIILREYVKALDFIAKLFETLR